jgi:PhnB protein
MSTVNPIPHSNPFSAYIVVKGADAALEFYRAAFDAKEHFRLSEPSGKTGHAEFSVYGGLVMLADEYPDYGALSPATIGGTPVSLHFYVADVDAVAARAVAAGATLLRPIKNEFYGDRVALISDPFGHKWFFATRIENVSPEEMQKRMNAMYAA